MTQKTTDKDNGAPWRSVVPTGPILRPADAAKYIGVSLTTYYDQASQGLLPSPEKIAGRASGVPRPWLDAVIAARFAQPELVA